MFGEYYSSSISNFLNTTTNATVDELIPAPNRIVELTLLNIWLEQIIIYFVTAGLRVSQILFDLNTRTNRQKEREWKVFFILECPSGCVEAV
jgi:hypothetical protein